MKFNILFILIISTLILGCTKNDESESDKGFIIGEWEGYDRSLVYEDGTIEYLPIYGNCEGHILQFYEDGRVHWVDFVG